MTITKDVNVTCIEGNMKICMGKGMTSFFFKDQEKFVFYTAEIDTLVKMIAAAKEALNEKV